MVHGVNYYSILLIYAPILLLLFLSLFRDKFEAPNALKLCKWSLFASTLVLFLSLGAETIISLWYVKLFPILKYYPYDIPHFEIFTFFYVAFLLLLVFIILSIYKVSIVNVFELKLSHFPFILKLCGILAVINILSIYLLDVNLLLNPHDLSKYSNIKDAKFIILFSFNTIILSPVEEEFIFRGLLYSPLYRKVGRRFAIIISSLIWTYAHFHAFYPSIQPFIIGIFLNGVVLAWLYDRSGSLIHPILLHAFLNSWMLIYL